jgi:hypothetical protein
MLFSVCSRTDQTTVACYVPVFIVKKTLTTTVPNRRAKKLSAREKAKHSAARDKASTNWWRRKLAQDRQREFEHGILAIANIMDDKNYRAFLSPYIIKHAAELNAFR